MCPSFLLVWSTELKRFRLAFSSRKYEFASLMEVHGHTLFRRMEDFFGFVFAFVLACVSYFVPVL